MKNSEVSVNSDGTSGEAESCKPMSEETFAKQETLASVAVAIEQGSLSTANTVSTATADSGNQRKAPIIALIALAGGLSLYAWCTRPFQVTLSQSSAPVYQLSHPQKRNVVLAAKKIGLKVLNPGEVFSFNSVVGPRTIARGFLPAPAYLENATSQSIGGGICLVSSLMYKCALEAGLEVVERTSHTRPVSSIPPGFDATVWYGQCDLKIKNNRSAPIRFELASAAEDAALTMKIEGEGKLVACVLTRNQSIVPPDRLMVEVYRSINNSSTLVSRDFYRLAWRKTGKTNHSQNHQG